MNYCGKCGAQLLDGMLFCTKCGAKIENTNSDNILKTSDSPFSSTLLETVPCDWTDWKPYLISNLGNLEVYSDRVKFSMLSDKKSTRDAREFTVRAEDIISVKTAAIHNLIKKDGIHLHAKGAPLYMLRFSSGQTAERICGLIQSMTR